jgi:hemerythrin
VLSHTSGELTPSQKEIGSSATFGTQDSLISSQSDYILRKAETQLSSFFPGVARHELEMLLNCPVTALNTGHVIQKKDADCPFVYLIVTGVVEVIDSKEAVQHMLSAGSMIGEINALSSEAARRTYRTKSSVNALQIPAGLYAEFVRRNFDFEETKRIKEIALFLQSTWLFGEMISSEIHDRVARSIKIRHFEVGQSLDLEDGQSLYLAMSGAASLFMEETKVDAIGPGNVFGEESVFFKRPSLMTAVVTEEGDFLLIKAESLKNVPIIEWKLLEVYERRITRFGSSLAEQPSES